MAKIFVSAIMPNPHVVDNVTRGQDDNVKIYVVGFHNARQLNKQGRLPDCKDRHRVCRAEPAFHWKPAPNRPALRVVSGLISSSGKGRHPSNKGGPVTAPPKLPEAQSAPVPLPPCPSA